MLVPANDMLSTLKQAKIDLELICLMQETLKKLARNNYEVINTHYSMTNDIFIILISMGEDRT